MKILNKINIEFLLVVLLIIGFILLIGILSKEKLNNTKKNKLYYDTVLEEDVLISTIPVEIQVLDKVKLEKDRNFLTIFLSPPFEVDRMEDGIKLPTGEIVNPEIFLIDENGVKYLLTYNGSRGKMACKYEFQGGLPKDTTYKKIVLKSEMSIQTEKIAWSGFDNKDRK